MSSDADRRFLAFATTVICAAALALAWSWRSTGIEASIAFGVLALFMVLSEGLAVTLPLGNMSLAHPLSVAAAVFLGPTYAALLAALSQLPSLFGAKRVTPLKVAFNASQLALATLGAGWSYILAGGRLLSAGPLRSGDFPRLILSILAVSVVGVGVNFVLTSEAVHLLTGLSIPRIWKTHFAAVAPTQVALGLVGVTMAQVVAAVGVPGLLLFVVPLLVARSTYHRYAEVNQAYADTVRSLVAAIEAKDGYTKGHSVRVAEYCVATARQMNMDDASVERIEYAALLHDLGKVGVAQRILSKTGKLTSEEFGEIRRHPDIGAHIIDSVPFLEDLVPVIRHHHERYDGRGYAHGLAGDDIPLAARIMAVADAYDAMTSHRPYRDALSPEHARAEVLAGSGTQFDSAVVEAFCLVLDVGCAGEASDEVASELVLNV
jgi:putative nucleotidyltransferase with HDIG domain